jgi:2-C-methyl-D-erythritol 2,4-cyclodiphosphate synthase
MSYRIGFGFDVHRLAEGENLILGGVNIEHSKGTVGHSDADVLIHAICDAILGAVNLRDIGFHFPDTDPAYKNADSKDLLKDVVSLLQEKSYSVVNIDCTLCLEKPKINPFIPQMQIELAPVLLIDEDAVSIKATTNERIGFVGREEGVAAYAVVLVKKD